MCTLRNFPHLIDHCIEWARAKFTDLFVSPAAQLQQFLEDPQGFVDATTAKVNQHVGGERTGAVERAVETLAAVKSLAMEVGLWECFFFVCLFVCFCFFGFFLWERGRPGCLLLVLVAWLSPLARSMPSFPSPCLPSCLCTVALQ